MFKILSNIYTNNFFKKNVIFRYKLIKEIKLTALFISVIIL